MKPTFTTLIILTLIAAALLTPFALSSAYLPLLRDRAFDLHELLRGDLYKKTTGFAALAFVLLEMLLVLRKRGRRWRIAIPGSMLLWRSLHIMVGVALLGFIVIHTGGSIGQNFNAAFLWVFFGVSLSALVGVVAETGILESANKSWGLVPASSGPIAKVLPSLTKGPLIRGLRGLWLSAHIFLVSIFCVMLGFHIFLAYYFQ